MASTNVTSPSSDARAPGPLAPGSAGVRGTGLVKHYGDVVAVGGISFEVPAGHFVSLLGPSGCGKTTTLRMIAGLERPTRGRIDLGGLTVNSVEDRTYLPPEKRGLGMVFQSYAIWPHLTVAENVDFPLRSEKPRRSATERRKRVEEVLGTVGLDHLADRGASALSGGQQQRVALARAIVGSPRALLLDEPLSNLDAKLRTSLRVELRELQQRLGITTVYVTHDQGEALALSDTIIVMRDGQIEQQGAPEEIYRNPATFFVADFIGELNCLTATPTETYPNGTLVKLDSPDLEAAVRVASSPRDLDRRGPSILAFRPERCGLVVSPEQATRGDQLLPARVRVGVYLGDKRHYFLNVGGVAISVYAGPEIRLADGQECWVVLPPEEELYLFPADDTFP